MAIKSNVAVALKYPNGMRPTYAEKFESISSATEQMTQLTGDLLLLARTDQAVSKPHPVDLAAVLKPLVDLYRPQSSDKTHHFAS